MADAVERLASSVVGVATRRHGASGVVWRTDVVVTSAALLWRAPKVSLVLPDGERIDGDVRGRDAGTDLAAVTFSRSGLLAAERATGAVPRIGDAVFAVGRDPSGLTDASFGRIGATAGAWRTWRGGRVERLIRLDGGLYPHLAGAPVADANGLVIGIGSTSLTRRHGVVLPIETVDRVLDQLLAHGSVRHGYLGIAAQPVRAQLDGVAVDGLLVSSLADDGPAARAGLRVSDVIVKVDGAPVAGLDALREKLQVGARVPLLVARGGATWELAIDVAQRPSRSCG